MRIGRAGASPPGFRSSTLAKDAETDVKPTCGGSAPAAVDVP
jgi:hypothetical protein